MAKKVYNELDRKIVEVLKEHFNEAEAKDEADTGMTLAEISAAVGEDVKPGKMTRLTSGDKACVLVLGPRAVKRLTKRKVTQYVLLTDEHLKKEDGTAYNYTPDAEAILKALPTMESPFTLADLAKALNREKMTSGSINHLVAKGNIGKLPEMREVPVEVEVEVNAYGFMDDIPEDETPALKA